MVSFISRLLVAMRDADEARGKDDTDVIQYSLKYIMSIVRQEDVGRWASRACEKTGVHVIDILLKMLTVNRKMMNMVQYVVDMLYRMVDAGVDIDSKHKQTFIEILKIGYSEYRDNGNLMRDVIKISPIFINEYVNVNR